MTSRPALLGLRLARSWGTTLGRQIQSPRPALSFSRRYGFAEITPLATGVRQFTSAPGSENDPMSSQPSEIDTRIDSETAVQTAEGIIQSTDLTTSQMVTKTAADYLQVFHETVSFDVLPWAATIPIAAITIRLLSFPLVYYNQIHMGRYGLASKEFSRIQHFVRKTPGSLVQKYVTFRRLRNLALRSAGTSQLSLFRWHMVVHLPLVIAASMGMRELARRVPDEWRTEGLGWFVDLSKSDPTGALPILTAGLWLWNLDPRSMPVAQGASSSEKRKAGIERIMTGAGEGLARVFQVLAVVSLSVTTELPAGILLFWFSNGIVTGVQRYGLSNDGVRRTLGLLTAEDLKQAHGPPVLKSTGTAVEKVREELSHVQREVLSSFQNRRVDEKLCRDVNKMLRKERWNGRITLDLEAVVRADDRDGKKYVAVIRRGTG